MRFPVWFGLIAMSFVTRPVAARAGEAPAAVTTQTARGEDKQPGDVTVPFSLGTNVYSHRFASGNKPAKDATLADRFWLSEFPGIGVFVTSRLRLGVNFQLTEAITNPPNDGRFTTFGILPQINYNFWGPLTATLVPTFLLRQNAVNEFAFGVQGVLAYGHPIGRGFTATAALEIPVFVTPDRSIGITPLAGVSYRIPR